MTQQSTPKTAEFRSLLVKAEALHAEISTLDAAICERDAIKVLMGDCRDEAEARKYLGDLMRAEETVIVKQARDSRLQAELADLVACTDAAFQACHAEVADIVRAAPRNAMDAFLDMLRASQFVPEKRRAEQAIPIVAEAIRPNVLVDMLKDRIDEAWRAVSFASNKTLGGRIEEFKIALKLHDKALVEHDEVVVEDKRVVAACEAFRKVLANG